MTSTEARVREALSAAADTRPIDVDRLWHEFATTTDPAFPSRQQTRWFIPLAAATATLLIIGLVMVGRAHVGGGKTTPADHGDAFALDQVPPWENGASAATFPLPTPVSTPVAFEVDELSAVPEPGHSQTVAYYADNPSRLCVVEIFRPVSGPARTTSIACGGESEYVAVPATRGVDWWLGTLPPPATHATVKVNGQPVKVRVVTGEHMPRPLFFAQLPRPTSPAQVGPITWEFTDDDGKVVQRSGDQPSGPPASPPDPNRTPVFHAPPVGDVATFDEPSQRADPAGSRRVLHVYYAGTDHGFCSNEQIITAERTRTVSEDCGFDTSDQVLSVSQWLPASSGGIAGDAVTFWGVMPPGATKTVVVTSHGQRPVQSAKENGMPTGVYAGSFTTDGSPAVFYFLDADGHVVAASAWRPYGS